MTFHGAGSLRDPVRSRSDRTTKGGVAALGLMFLLAAGCGESVVKSDTAHANRATRPAAADSAVKSPATAATEPTAANADRVAPVTGDESAKPNADAAVVTASAADSAAESRSSDAVKPVSATATAGGDQTAVKKGDAPAAKPASDKTKTDGPRKVELLVKDRKFKPEGRDGSLRVSYDDIDLLKVLNMEPVTLDAVKKMPDWLRNLNGKPIRIRGFMYPPFQETGISAFVLARDNQICCFGRNPKIYDLVKVTLKSGTTTDYIQNRPFDVVGKFRIEMDALEDDGTIFGLYYIDDAVVIEK